jgi:hypothetical protein
MASTSVTLKCIITLHTLLEKSCCSNLKKTAIVNKHLSLNMAELENFLFDMFHIACIN